MKRNSVWGITLKAGTIQTTQVFGSRKEAEDAIAKISHLSNGFEAVELGPVNSPELPDGWIKCSERMPKVGDVVLTAYQGATNIGEMERSGRDYRYFTSIISGRELPADFWMPLPAPLTPEK